EQGTKLTAEARHDDREMALGGPVVILGCGFTGGFVVRSARAVGARVRATIRDGARARELEHLGAEPVVAAELSASVVRELVEPGAHVLVAFPPDGATDARIAPELERAHRVVYLSSTAVYGSARGRVDERTPINTTKTPTHT